MYRSGVALTQAMGPKVAKSHSTNHSIRLIQHIDWHHRFQPSKTAKANVFLGAFVIVCQLDRIAMVMRHTLLLPTSQQEHVNFWNTVGTQTLSTYSLIFSSIKENNKIIKKSGHTGVARLLVVWHGLGQLPR